MNRPAIVRVAIRFRGVIWSLPAPNRHADVMKVVREAIELTPSIACADPSDEDHGFLDADGLFLNRRQALYNAQKNNQLKPNTKIKLGQLYSEDIW